MGAKFEVVGSDVKIIFEWTQPTEWVTSFVDEAAEYLWQNETNEDGEITNPFSEASNQAKLDTLYKYAGQSLVNLVNSHVSNKAQKEARESANKLEL